MSGKSPTTLDEIRALNPAYVINRQGKDHVLYAGLLDYAHLHGLKRIATTLLQAPSDANGQMAICSAEVETERGTFCGIGDADIGNAGKMIAPHRVRFAETRAKARALRDAYNVGGAAFEELGDDDDQPAARPAPARQSTPTATPATPQQIERLRTLHAACLKYDDGVVLPDLSGKTYQEASAAIADMTTLGSQLKAEASPAPVQPPHAGVPASAQPATPQQKERLAKLQAALGRQADPATLAHLSFEAAAIAITEAVQAFNARTPAQQAARQPVAAR